MDYILSLTAGITSGAVFFIGLAWTIKKLPDTRSPGLLSLVSFLLRMFVVIGTLLITINGRWQNALIYLAGFLAARIAVTLGFKRGGIRV